MKLRQLFLFALGVAFSSPGQAQQPAANPPIAANATQPPADPTPELLSQAYQLMVAGKTDAALEKANAAILANPRSINAYILRGSIYSQKKLWTPAQRDFETALKIDSGNLIVKFNLAEIKFVQKAYDAARVDFVSMEGNPDIGDLASYKVFLCDLFSGRSDVAAKELDAFNQVGSKPSYYYGNAAWSLFYHRPEEARDWLTSAANIYSAQKNNFYSASLKELGYLPLPPQPLTH